MLGHNKFTHDLLILLISCSGDILIFIKHTCCTFNISKREYDSVRKEKLRGFTSKKPPLLLLLYI